MWREWGHAVFPYKKPHNYRGMKTVVPLIRGNDKGVPGPVKEQSPF